MEEKRYYTPNLIEFHVGFEFQTKDGSNGDWYDDAITEDCLYKFTDLFKYSQHRVKFLDRSDIESLGWVYNKGWYAHQTGDTLDMQVGGSVRIFREAAIGTTMYPVFQGVIKNKSELKKVMQMIGITKQDTKP